MAWTLADFNGTYWRTINVNALYISPTGDDRNDGHPKRPLRTPAAATATFGQYYAGTVIFAPGTYPGTGLTQGTYISDQGSSILEGGGVGYCFDSGITVIGMTISNYVQLARVVHGTFTNCKLRNIAGLSITGHSSFGFVGFTFRGNEVKDCALSGAYAWSQAEITGNTFVNSSLYTYYPGGATTLRDNIFDANSTAYAVINGPYCYLDYSTIAGKITVYNAGNGYPTPFNTLADFQATPEYAQLAGKVALRGAGTDPGFANPAAGDYTLLPTSIVRNDALNGAYIGAYPIGFSHTDANDVETATNAQFDNTLQAWVPIDPTQDMVLEFNWKYYGQSWALQGCQLLGLENVVQGQTIDATLSYANNNGVAVDTASGNIQANITYWVKGYASVTYNGNQYTTDQFFVGVANVNTYAANGTGVVVQIIETPNARVFELKYSVAATTLAAAQQEGNTRGWKRFLHNRQPTYNVATGRTNGETLFDASTAEPLVASWGKPKLTLKANSLP